MSALGPNAAGDLAGHVVILTGAGGGIGRSTAGLLAAAGATIVCVDIDARVDPVVAEIEALGRQAVAEQVDISRQAEVEALVARTVERFGRLDGFVNNAAVIKTNLTADVSEEELHLILSVNLKGVFFGCKAAARVMAAAGRGSIVNVASSAIDLALPQTVAYSMAKAGVAQLTKCLAAEVGPQGVRVNTVAPGFVLTPMTSRHFTNADGSIDEAKKQVVVAELSKGKVLPEPTEAVDIAQAILFLLSPAARQFTGQILRPNGGISMPW